ncbi:hypothetical protein FSP39_024078 [Pinctada imbricata]|uniref:Uncharacterized protein n=1 Tax=Pinctada imbricata TaxID=66713 RepID=A0AA88YCY7_PINIB|nr:hypothetical protein FSP39_024078 [Pinctada imbricata]
MYAYEDQHDSAESYQRSIRERANVSLHELENLLIGSPESQAGHASQTSKAKSQLHATVNPRNLKWYEESARPRKYRDAASQLQTMLSQESLSMGQSRGTRGQPGVPSLEEAATILHSQSVYMQQLESENMYIKDELSQMRAKLSELIEENKRLHEELKTSVLHEILGENIEGEKDENFFLTDDSSHIFHSRELKHLQVELERLSSLHSARVSRLEAQLEHARSEVQKYEQMVEDLRNQLRMQDVVPTRESGLMTGDLVSDKQRNFLHIKIDSLTKERDELMDHVTSLKSRLQEMAHREEDAYQQMKKGIEMVEQAQLEQTQALVEKEQTKEELHHMKERFDSHILDTQMKLQEERESVRKESHMMIEQINTKLKEMTEQYAAASAQMDKMAREKIAMINEMDEMKLQLRRFDKEASMAADTYRTESTNASIQKSYANQEVTRLRRDLDIAKREKDETVTKQKLEVEDLSRRLKKAERELLNSKEECIHLTTNNQALERELHLAKLARDSVERGRNEDLKAMTKRCQNREEELNSFIEDIEDKHGQTRSEMDTMLKKQNRLIGKLRDECKRQAGQIEKLTKRNRNECGQLRKQNEELRMRLERAVARLNDLDNQADQHGRVHEKMKERLKMMDDHAQHQSQQILDLLARLSALTRDRQLLSREVEFLRKQITRTEEEDLQRFFSSNRALVDDIIKNVNAEEREQKDTYITVPKSNVEINDLVDS